jgi:hypothetical protein
MRAFILASADRRPENIWSHAATCNASQSSSTYTMSAISQSLEVTPAVLAFSENAFVSRVMRSMPSVSALRHRAEFQTVPLPPRGIT